MRPAATTKDRYGAGNGANAQVYEAILSAANSCFMRYGVRRTSMDDIAEAAGVSRATVYNYVSSKEYLIAELVVQEASRINAEAWEALDTSLPSDELIAQAELLVLRGALASQCADIFASNDVVRLTADAIGHSNSFAAVQRSYWSSVFEIIRQRGELRPGLDEAEAVDWLDSISFMLTRGPTTFAHDLDAAGRYLRLYVAPAFVIDDGTSKNT